MYKKDLKSEAAKLRVQGFSYSYISKKLIISKSTLSLWLKDIDFIPNKLIVDKINESNRKLVEIKRVDKMQSMSHAFDFAEEKVGKLTNRDIFILGIGLYIGEGSKVGNFIRIANSDPRIIRFAIRWFKVLFGLTDSNFKIRIHMYPDNNEEEVIKFWINALGIKRQFFYPSSFDRRVNKQRKNKNTLPYGTAHLSIVSNGDKNLGVLLHRKILASIDSVLR
jgi:hypothetical protein